MDESGKGNSPTVHDTRGDDEDGYKAPVKESGSDPDEVTAEEEVLVVQDGGGKQESETDELLDHPEVEEVDFEPQEWKAPDGGWGWVVMLNAMAISIIVDGITYTFGIFLGEFEAEFRAPKSEISLASSVQVGAYLMIGPVASALTNRFGCRNVILAGSVIAAVAYLLSYFSDSVMVLVITYGFIGGIGLGMMYLPAIVSVSLYFDKKRALATCTASCGSGIGTFIMAPLAEWLLNEYNWRWTLVIQAGIILNGLVFGALTRPLDFGWTERMTNEKMDGIDMDKIEKGGKRNNEVAVLRGRKESEEGRGEMKRKRHSSTGSRHSSEGGHWLVLGRGAGRTRHLSGSTILSSSRARGLNIRNPIPQIILTDHDEKTTVVLLAGRKPSEETDEGNAKSVKASQFSSTPNMNVISSSTPNTKVEVEANKNKQSEDRQQSSRSRAYTIASSTKPYKRTSQGDASQVSPAHSPHDQSWVPLGLSFISLSEMHLNQSHEEKRTNMSRASASTGQYEWAAAFLTKDVKKGFSIQSISTVSKREESGSSTCGKLWSCLGDSFSENMEEMLNFSILKNKLYWFVLAGNFIVMLGFYVPFVYMKERAIDIGIDETRAAFLLSVIGLANVGGRALTGVLMQFWKINTVLVTSVALIIGSIPITVCPLLDSYIQLVFLALVFGLCTAAYLSLCSVLLCDLLGVHYLTNAFGYVILFRGVACLIGPPMAGAIIDSTGEFDNAFYLGGAMLFLGGLSHFLLYIIYLSPCRGWWTHRRGAEKRGKKSQGDVEECKTKMLENEEERGENTIENV